MPNEKSSSFDSSKRFFCESVRTLYTSCLVSAGVNSGSCRRCRCPCTRTCGGVLVAMWRSEPSISTSVLSRSGSVSIIQLSALTLLDRLPDDFLDGGQAVLHFAQPAHAQREHP